MWVEVWGPTFQSSEVTSLLLGTSWPPSRMQCLRTSWVDPPVLFSLRFQIRAVESPDLPESTHTHINTHRQPNIRHHNLALTFKISTDNSMKLTIDALE